MNLFSKCLPCEIVLLDYDIFNCYYIYVYIMHCDNVTDENKQNMMIFVI